MSEPPAVRVGCSGWQYRHWSGDFYPRELPQDRWLEHYARSFDTVELNNSFYRLPPRSVFAGWRARSPSGFLFAVKASRYLTHIKRLTELGQGVALFYDRIAPLVQSPKLGPVLWQLPESFRRDDDRLGAALAALPPGRHCFEFRHESWFSDDVYSLLRDHGVALVIGDRPERPFQTHEMTADFTLVRFHYGARGRRGNYSESELDHWAEVLREWSRRVDVFAYFNNDWEQFAPRNARGLARRLGVEHVSGVQQREAVLK